MVLDTEKRKAKEDFCKSLGWSIDIHWFEVTGYSVVSTLLRAKIGMTPGPVAFNGFYVTILNKNEGEVDGCSFRFHDYLDDQQKASSYPVLIQAIVHDIGDEDDGKFGWSRCEIESARPLTNAIEDYIAQFK